MGGGVPHAGPIRGIPSRGFEVCDQDLCMTPNFIKNCFLIGYNIFSINSFKTNC